MIKKKNANDTCNLHASKMVYLLTINASKVKKARAAQLYAILHARNV